MRPKLTAHLAWLSIALVWFGCLPTQARGADLKLEAQLLWGTDDAKSPNPAHKPVSPDIKKKLAQLPLKWSNYFEVSRKTIEATPGATKRVSLSEACELEIKNLDGSKIEVTHFGKGRRVGTQTQVLPRGEILVLGGNAPNATAWLIVLKRLE